VVDSDISQNLTRDKPVEYLQKIATASENHIQRQ